MTFHRLDRALCINDGSSALVKGQTYYVLEVRTFGCGSQTLNLVGFGPDDRFNASRFTRLADPDTRRSRPTTQ